ncbi:MAG: helix-turn-helix domain-containing protein [Burkholderiaceae bacterium]
MNPGKLLAQSRKARGLSQMELAFRLDISQRHVSFLERDRSRPSRQLLLAWMREVQAPHAMANAALQAAGFSATPGHAPEDDMFRASSVAALGRMLAAHDPLPGIVFDGDWTVVEMNEGGRDLCGILMPELFAGGRNDGASLDMIATLMVPGGLLSRMVNGAEVGASLCRQLQTESWMNPALHDRAARLARFLEERYGLEDLQSAPPGTRPPVLEMVFDTELGCLRFLTLQSTFGSPQEISLASLRIELWYPADAFTREALERVRRGKAAIAGNAVLRARMMYHAMSRERP